MHRERVRGSGMKAWLTLSFLFCALSACSNSGGLPPATPPAPGQPGGVPKVTVVIPPGATDLGTAAYGINPFFIAAGTLVTWVNNDSVDHSATSDTDLWNSGSLSPGQSYSFLFVNPGTYPYFCTEHGKASMSGTIVATETSPSPSPSASPAP